jgi:hypothetical protein
MPMAARSNLESPQMTPKVLLNSSGVSEELPGLFVQPDADPTRLGRSILHWRVWLLAHYKIPRDSPRSPMSLPLITNDLHISSLD